MKHHSHLVAMAALKVRGFRLLNGQLLSRMLIYGKCTHTNHYTTTASASNSTTMRAWQINAFGSVSNLTLNETRVPEIQHPSDVLVRVHAASVNPIDTQMLGGYGHTLLSQAGKLSRLCEDARPEFPITLGRDCSGVVARTGKAVSQFKPGDKVWCAVSPLNQGTFADYVLCSTSEISKRPEMLADSDAASLPYVAATTWMAVSTIGRLSQNNCRNKRVLILGASGGIGTFAVQLLRSWDAYVVCTCAVDAADLTLSLGAHETVDYRSDSSMADLRRMKRFDFILNATSTDQVENILDLLRVGGQYVTLVSPLLANNDQYGVVLGTTRSALSLACHVTKCLGHGKHYRWALFRPNGQALAAVAKLVDEGKIRPVVDQEFPYESLPEAIEKVSTSGNRGKTVINMK